MRARVLGSGSGCLAKADRDGSVNEGIQNTFLSNPGSWNNKVGWVRKSGVQKACLRAIALSFLSRYSRLYVQAGSYFTKYTCSRKNNVHNGLSGDIVGMEPGKEIDPV